MQSNGVPSQLINEDPQPTSIPPLSEVCAKLNERVEAFLRKTAASGLEIRAQDQTRISLNVVEEALKRYDLASLSLAYNGGKDCLVLLIIFLSSLHRHLTATNQPFPSSIPAIYAYPPDPFPSVTSFVETSSQAYHLDLAHILTNPRPSADSKLPRITIRDAFEYFLRPRPHIRAIFVGTRRTDPHGEKLTFFDPTDHGWPSFMRVHPVIDWKLAEIWAFLKCDELKDLEYCGLYDQGYTSLGGMEDTVPNPKLKRTTLTDGEVGGDACEKEVVSYRPAWELVEDGEERLGREVAVKKST